MSNIKEISFKTRLHITVNLLAGVSRDRYFPAKIEEHPRTFPNFQNRAHCQRDLRDNKHNSFQLGRKYLRTFILGHYLFREANSFPKAKLEENCELRETDNVRGQIPEHIFAPNGGNCFYKRRF